MEWLFTNWGLIAGALSAPLMCFNACGHPICEWVTSCIDDNYNIVMFIKYK
jgi:hypothetical protein